MVSRKNLRHPESGRSGAKNPGTSSRTTNRSSRSPRKSSGDKNRDHDRCRAPGNGSVRRHRRAGHEVPESLHAATTKHAPEQKNVRVSDRAMFGLMSFLVIVIVVLLLFGRYFPMHLSVRYF